MERQEHARQSEGRREAVRRRSTACAGRIRYGSHVTSVCLALVALCWVSSSAGAQQYPVGQHSPGQDPSGHQRPLDLTRPPGDLIQEAGGPADILTADDVVALITTAAQALNDSTMAVAVVDRVGGILGVYRRPGASGFSADVAVSLARTGAFFSNDQAPLSSRTVRSISGIHFPAGIPNTPNAALYGIEDTNRGCRVDVPAGSPYATLPPPRSIAGTFGVGGAVALPCEPSDRRGCSIGGPILDEQGIPLQSVGITTGKANLRDRDPAGNVEAGVNPGGIPLFRASQVIGAIGVAGVSTDRAEYVATLAAATTGRGIGFPSALPPPGAVFIDGIRLPFFRGCRTIDCIVAALSVPPPGSAPGSLGQGQIVHGPFGGQQALEGYLIGPRASTVGGLTQEEVGRIVDQAIASAQTTRAVIRLPFGQASAMVIAVADQAGEILAAYRMPDATMFSLDVAVTKSRNAYFFSSREGYDVLRQFVDDNPHDDYRWTPDPPSGQGWAVTNRTLSYGGQPLFPPGIDLEKPPTPGPWFDLFVYDSINVCTEGRGPSRGGDRSYLNQSGIVWFPGSAPLYKDGQLVGGLGISGDGVEQDDLVSSDASVGFRAPPELRVDRSVIVTGEGHEVRLPYWKFPRNPRIR